VDHLLGVISRLLSSAGAALTHRPLQEVEGA
jgi:hypothetical protein